MKIKVQAVKSKRGDLRWWGIRTSDAAMRTSLWSAFEVARAASTGRAEAYERLRCLADTGLAQDVSEDDEPTACDENVIGQVVETAASKLLENRPDAHVQTDGANDTAQMKAKRLAAWVKSACEDMGLHDVVEEAWMEAEKVGTGAYRIFEEHGRPCAEVVYCEDVHVNPIEAKHNAVRTLYHERTMDRAALAAMFPDKASKVMRSDASLSPGGGKASEDEEANGSEAWADMITVVESWRLALVPKPKDGEYPKGLCGRHVIAVKDVTLLDEAYEDNQLPMWFFRWRPRSRSFWGIGIPEGTQHLQAQMNIHAGTIEETLESMVPQYWFENGENIARIDNIPGRMNTCDKPPIMVAAHPGVLQAFTAREEKVKERMFTSQGVSQQEAQAQKPAGLNSGRAQLVHSDIKSKRLLRQGRQLEDGYKWGFKRTLAVADSIVEAADEGDSDALEYLAGEGEDLQSTPFADVRISDFMYRVRVHPISQLPDSPAGRLEFVMDMMNAGLIGQDDAMPLMSMPDIEGHMASTTSMRTLAKAFVDHAATGEYENVASMLTPLDDHATVIEYGHQRFAKERLRGKSADDLKELVAVITRATDMKSGAEAAAAEAMGPPQPPAPPAGAPPMPPEGGAPPMM